MPSPELDISRWSDPPGASSSILMTPSLLATPSWPTNVTLLFSSRLEINVGLSTHPGPWFNWSGPEASLIVKANPPVLTKPQICHRYPNLGNLFSVQSGSCIAQQLYVHQISLNNPRRAEMRKLLVLFKPPLSHIMICIETSQYRSV